MIEEEKKVVTMGKTINAFFKFILDDPIMLGLCIAIGVLIVLFIIVLMLGKKTNKSQDKNSKKEEALLRTEINLEKLDDSLGNSLENIVTGLNSLDDNNNMDIDVQEVPVTIEEEPTKLEVTPEETLERTESFSLEGFVPENIPSFDDYKIEAPTAEEIKEITAELGVIEGAKQDDISSEPVAPVEKSPVFEIPNLEPEVMDFSANPMSSTVDDYSLESLNSSEDTVSEESNIFDSQEPFGIVESTVNPVEEKTEMVESSMVEQSNLGLEDLLVSEFTFSTQETPVISSNVEYPEVLRQQPLVDPVIEASQMDTTSIENLYNDKLELAKEQRVEESLEDMYTLSDEDLPEINVEDFSRTAIIRHVPVLETNVRNDLSNVSSNNSSEDLDDLDLPKFSGPVTEDKSGLNILRGESFNIEK